MVTWLKKKFQIDLLDIFKESNHYSAEAKKYMDQGLLVPDELTVKILLDKPSFTLKLPNKP